MKIIRNLMSHVNPFSKKSVLKYIFLDTWVYSQLTNDETARRLTKFLRRRRYRILITTQSLVELYNADWKNTPNDKERMLKTAYFLSENRCAIIDPAELWEAELATYPDPVATLPLRLDLDKISKKYRAEALLTHLRGEQIKKWRDEYEELKESWLASADTIIEHAYTNGTLTRDAKGNVIQSQGEKEVFFVSMDLRLADPSQKDALLQQYFTHRQSGKPLSLSAIRLTTLCFWYLYIGIDPANRIKTLPSDMADIYHLSLLPYCAAFTLDGSLGRLLERMNEPISPVVCELITPAKLRQYL